MQHTSFFVHFFAVVVHDCNVKLPCYTLYVGNVVCVPVNFFSPRWPLAFLTAAIKFSCFSSNKKMSPLYLFFISRSGSFSVIHVNVDIEIKSKEKIGFAVQLLFYL